MLEHPKLLEIFNRGVEYGRINAQTPKIRAMVLEAERRQPRWRRPQGGGRRESPPMGRR